MHLSAATSRVVQRAVMVRRPWPLKRRKSCIRPVYWCSAWSLRTWKSSGSTLVGVKGFEPSASWSRTQRQARPGGCSTSQSGAGAARTPAERARGAQANAPRSSEFAAGLLPRPTQPRAVPDVWLTVADVAARLAVSRATVYKLCAAEKLPHSRVSNAIRIDRNALDLYMMQNGLA